MRPVAISFAAGLLLLLLSQQSAHAYVWRCHTSSGDIWTDQPRPEDDCEEYDSVFNQGAAPPPPFPPYQTAPAPVPPPPLAQSIPPQVLPPPPPPPVVVAPPLYSRYYYNPFWPGYPPGPYYGGPGLYLGVPPLAFEFRFGGHGGHRYWR